MFTAYWEVVNEDRDDYLNSMEAVFNNFTDAVNWLGDKDDNIDYYCVITDETGRVVHTGWMP